MSQLRSNFQSELMRLNNELIQMGSFIEQMIERSVALFSHMDEKEAREIIAMDDEVNQMEKSIELKCLNLFMRQQPVAGDLRRITTAMKMITDMERIADHATDIAALSLEMKDTRLQEVCASLTVMADIAMEMLATSIASYVNADLDAAKRVLEKDDALDALFSQVKKELAEDIKEKSDIPLDILNALMAAKYLERIGDHSVNIGEWVIFAKTGVLDLDH